MALRVLHSLIPPFRVVAVWLMLGCHTRSTVQPQAADPAPSPPAVASTRPTSAPATRPNDDPALRAAIRKSLKVGMYVNQWRDNIDLHGFASCKAAPVAFDFRVCLIARGREWDVGRLTVPRGESDELYILRDSEQVPGFMDAVKQDPRITVVLRPVGPSKIGGEAVRDEVWFPEVVVNWYWY